MSYDEIGSPISAARRQLLTIGTATAAAAVIAPAVAAPTATAATAPTSASADTRIRLVRGSAAGIRAVEVPLAVRTPASTPWTSPRLRSDEFALVGFSWPAHAPTPEIAVRVGSGGSWQDWRTLPILDDRPDADDEATLRHATHPLWVGVADAVQVRVAGNRPAHVVMSLIRPDGVAGDVAARTVPAPRPLAAPAARTTAPGTTSARQSTGVAPRPAILTRKDWNADESWRSGSPTINTTIQQVHVHHTVSGNTYSAQETPGLIRGMYYYHTRTLGWSDLGYNFLVDRFGRIWEGRAGGIGKAVRGAHTLGFNSSSCGVSVIGNLEQVQPTDATIAAIARVAAWKLSRYGRDPLGTVAVTSEGSDRFSRSTRVTLPVIDGHRDTNQTACPGRHLYARLGDVRKATHALMAGGAQPPSSPAVTVSSAPVLAGDPTPGSTLTVTGGVAVPATATVSYAWLRDGTPIKRAKKATRRVAAADAGHLLSVVVTWSAEGREPTSMRLDAAEPVRYRPAVDVAVKGRGPRMTVGVAVTTPDGTDPGGTATIRVRRGAKTVPVVAGVATATFRRKPGEHVVRVAYSGSDVAHPASAETSWTTTAPAGGTRRR